MTDQPGSATPDAEASAREYTHFAEPSRVAAAESDWSEPTLTRHAEDSIARPQSPDVAPTAPPQAHFNALPAPPTEVLPPEPPAGAELPPPPRVEAPPVQAPPPSPAEAAPASPTEAGPASPADEAVAPPPPGLAPANEAETLPPRAPAREPSRGYYVPPVAARRSAVIYEQGTVPDGHQALIESSADVAVAAMPIPLRVLDVGCGAGELLAELIVRVPYAEMYVGVDPLPDLVPQELRDSDPRLGVVRAAAESLPFADASFDLVIATSSFAYWKNQRAGLAELSRVVADNGRVVLVEPTSGGGRIPSPKDIATMLSAAGLTLDRTETVGRSRLGRPTARAYVAAP